MLGRLHSTIHCLFYLSLLASALKKDVVCFVGESEIVYLGYHIAKSAITFGYCTAVQDIVVYWRFGEALLSFRIIFSKINLGDSDTTCKCKCYMYLNSTHF